MEERKEIDYRKGERKKSLEGNLRALSQAKAVGWDLAFAQYGIQSNLTLVEQHQPKELEK
ncbi:5860_t:CDS:2, partial [Cetraspora pellucida]